MDANNAGEESNSDNAGEESNPDSAGEENNPGNARPNSGDSTYASDEEANNSEEMTPTPDTPTNPAEAELAKEYVEGKRAEKEAGDLAFIQREAAKAYAKDPQDRTHEDKKFMKTAACFCKIDGLESDHAKSLELLRDVNVLSVLGENAAEDGNSVRDKLIKAGFEAPDPISPVNENNLPSPEPDSPVNENNLPSPKPDSPVNENNLSSPVAEKPQVNEPQVENSRSNKRARDISEDSNNGSSDEGRNTKRRRS
ncbi:hypothetical protein G7Y89_g4654 [Cudoniella acicularis]|uniref:Uncharacterized protein n=1 Tax=Cudoniella acicularis TaxID=354080 RepID=A0A8H4W6H0_9HELO|nr:hypothetical protein G7Y89_g4654 [Cudoniella acicularis]